MIIDKHTRYRYGIFPTIDITNFAPTLFRCTNNAIENVHYWSSNVASTS